MARDFVINGECMVKVKGHANSLISGVTDLGLATDQIRVSVETAHDPLIVNAWGNKMPVDVQWMLGTASIQMNLIHVDPQIMNECLHLSMGGASSGAASGAPVVFSRAGLRLGNGLPRLSSGNYYIGVNLTSPAGFPGGAHLQHRFLCCYLTGPPIQYSLGNEKSIFALNWQCIPYTTDPFNGVLNSGDTNYGSGFGAFNYPLYDHSQDT